MNSILETGIPASLCTDPPIGLLRSLDPRGRIIAAVLFAAVCVSLHNIFSLVFMLFTGIIASALSPLPLWQTMKRVIMMDGFVILMLVLLPFTIAGDPFFTLFGFPASYQGLMRAVIIGIKANAILMVLMALVGSMEATTLGHALSRLHFPSRLVLLLLFTVRYIDIIHDESRRLLTATKTRGFIPGNNRHTYRTFGYLIGMLLVRALERSNRILDAMKCRGFDGHFPLLTSFRFRKRDILFTLVCIIILVTPIVLELHHHVAPV